MIGHAGILSAPKESHRALALHEAKAALCAEGGCGSCRVCHLIETGQHPDVIYVEPDGASIKIGQVRSLISELSIRPYLGEGRFVAILSADLMTEQAQNALLKTIEEPNAGCRFLLFCESRDRLLPTIRSRCSTVRPPVERAAEDLCYAARVMGRDAGERALWQRDFAEEGPLNTAWEAGKKALYLGFSKKYSMMEETLTESRGEESVVLQSMEAMMAYLLKRKTHAIEEAVPELARLEKAFLYDGYTAARIMELIQTAERMSAAHVGKRGYYEWLSLAVMEEIDENRSRS